MTQAENGQLRQHCFAVPTGWVKARFGEIYELSYGKGLPKSARNESGRYPVFGSNGIVGYHDSFLIDGPVLIVGRKGSTGTVWFSSKPCWPIDTTYYVRANRNTDIRFALYLLDSLRLNQFDRSTAVPGLNRNDAYDLPVYLPPLPEQHRIVVKVEELLSELDAGIESLKKARAQLASYRQAILKHAFEGKITAQWRKENKDSLETPEQLLACIKRKRETYYEQRLREWRTAVMSWGQGGKSGRRSSKPSEFKVTERIEQDELTDLPHLPRFWQYVRLSEIADIGSGMSVSRSRKLDDPIEVPYLSVANVQRGELDLSRVKTMLIERAQLATLELKQGDVLFNEGGDRDKLGRGWMWDSQMVPCITQNHVFRASPFLGFHEHSKWVSHWGNSFGQRYFEAQGKQTTNLASINKTVLSKFPIPLPPISEQVEILRRIDVETSTLDHVESSITAAFRNLSALRQSILKTAFSGQLVPQDPRDEPASFLLDRIKTEREQIPSRVMRRKTAEREKTKVTA